METTDDLLKSLNSADPEEAADAAEALGARRCLAAAPAIIAVLRRTPHHVVRNAAAIALRDIGDPLAADALASLLVDPRTEGHIGTLLYALGAFDCAPYAALLFDLAKSENPETRIEAQKALDGIG